jgi:RNA polymerase sigma factor (TIGR02999 family)
MMHDNRSVTEILEAGDGDEQAVAEAVSLLYEDLKRLARRRLQGRGSRLTLDTVGLVHETYLKLSRLAPIRCRTRDHFLATVARAMRQIMVDYARRRSAGKRWGELERVPLEEPAGGARHEAELMIQVDRALETLARFDERLCRLVECRVYAGFTIDETAAALGISRATVCRDWVRARAWLRREIGDSNDGQIS